MADIAPVSDSELVKRFRSGDREAFAALYRAHYAAVFRFAWHMTGDRTLAAEITQDVFVWLIHHPADFDPARGSLPAFLGGVARKTLQRQRREGLRWMPLQDATLRSAGPPDLARTQDTTALRQAIAALPERYRQALVLCDLQERTYEEAAEAMGCATGTVRSRLHRARALLARKLKSHKEGQPCAV